MNYFSVFNRIVVASLFIFLVSCGKVSTVVEKTASVPSPPEKKIEYKTRPVEVKPEHPKKLEIKPKENQPSVPVVSKPLPGPGTIGCILPLSGRYEDYGNKALDAIILAAGIFDKEKRTPWKIIVEDSAIQTGIKTAMARLAESEDVIAVIAIAGTAEAAEIAQEAVYWKVPVILITPKEKVTGAGNYVFQNFLTPTQQIKALVDYSLNDLNCTIFSILYPKDNYGAEMVKIFSEEAERSGGRIVRAVPYDSSQTDFTDAINKVTKNAITEVKKANADNPETKAQISPDFEALFIPDSHSKAKMIASQLAFYDVKGITLLGTSLWNSPYLLKKGAEYIEGAVFADSFYVNGFYPETNDFVDIFYTAYRREPENIEALSYDTMKMILNVLENENIRTREQFIGSLGQLDNYSGATGSISFSGDRVAKKTAFILRVRNGKVKQVK